MKKNFNLLFLLFPLLTFAQITFEKAYIINNDGTKTECFIKNKQWNTYPNEIEYKSNQNSETKIGKIDNIKEFGIGNDIYKRFEVQVDKSPADLNDLSQKSNPDFIKEIVFLKLLVDGNLQLYKYSGNQSIKFFYKKDTEETPTQLIYKKYKNSDNGETYSNNEFKNQLKEITGKTVNLIDYKESQITKLFEKNNQTVRTSDQKDSFHLTIRPGINFSKMSVYNNLAKTYNLDNGIDLENKINFRIGLEAEYNFGFNKNKWALIFEPEFFTTYKNEKEVNYLSNSEAKQNMIVEYSTLKFPIGFRHYMYLNSKNRIFLNVLYSWNVPTKFKIYYEEREDILNSNNKNIANKNNMIYGLGYSYNNKYFFEARYQTVKLLGFGKQFNSLSLILGYRFLYN